MTPEESILEFSRRFWGYVDTRAGATACWPWKASLDSSGYGKVSYMGRSVTAHRVARAMSAGGVKPGDVVRHTCDNPKCCNPAHLLVGTQFDNIADRQARGRQARGPRNGRWKPELHLEATA